MGFIDFLSGFIDGAADSIGIDLNLSKSAHEDELQKSIDTWNSINWNDENDIDSKVRATFNYADTIDDSDKEAVICGGALMKARCFLAVNQFDDSLEAINRVLNSQYDETTLNTDYIVQCKQEARELKKQVLQSKKEANEQQNNFNREKESWDKWASDIDFSDYTQVQERTYQVYCVAKDNQWISHYLLVAMTLILYLERTAAYELGTNAGEQVQWALSKGKEILDEALKIARTKEILYVKGLFDLISVVPNANATRKIDIIVSRMPKINEIEQEGSYLNVDVLQDTFDTIYNKKLDLSL